MTAQGSSLPLLVWLSPAFPVGAFAYSHGLEAAVDAGDIHDAASLQAWLADLIEHGSLRSDAILTAQAWRMAQDKAALQELNDLALALASSRERYLETSAQGSAFITAITAAWACTPATLLASLDTPIAYPVAVGACAAGHEIDLSALVEAYVVAFLGNLISAAVRLGPVGQTDGQKITAALLARLNRLAHFAQSASLDDLGSIALRSDIAAMQHETLYSRLFRS
jgi:urease accessory protein